MVDQQAVQRGGNMNLLWHWQVCTPFIAFLRPASATRDTPKGDGEEETLSLRRFVAIV